eukprot:CAMPEP_0169166708 /NCGR_PEP_ID=MMETSP1015-20121227/60078_1 /TAXON_ID=342587 /ORGANISM="Karlodinium micrum, Strain CCMP2283" /LENGTH=42 /DNA_ID= /DNA_START= /DNA_END= /DNA_ORIENTATION=
MSELGDVSEPLEEPHPSGNECLRKESERLDPSVSGALLKAQA